MKQDSTRTRTARRFTPDVKPFDFLFMNSIFGDFSDIISVMKRSHTEKCTRLI